MADKENSNLIAQFIKVIWNKKHRGGQAAAKRNGVVDQRHLPAAIEKHASDSGKALVHRVVYSHINDFAEPIVDQLVVFEIKELKNIGCFQFQTANGAAPLELVYRWYGDLGGMPARTRYDKTGTKMPLKETAFILKLNEIGKAEYNGRFADDDDGGAWRYEKLSLNVGVFERIDSRVFLKTAYDKYYRQFADLW